MSSAEFKSVAWSNQLEEYFAETGEKCQGYAYLHKKSEAIFGFRRTIIDIPVIVLSTIAGTLSIGNSSIFGEENERVASMGIGLLSLGVGVLNTVATYFGFAKRAENHRLCSIEYSKLFRFISIELALPQRERMGCGDLLKVVKEQYERLQEISPLVPNQVIEDFKDRFKKYEKIAKPSETNGLQEIQIFRDGVKQSFYDIVKRQQSDHGLEKLREKITEEIITPVREPEPENLRIEIPSAKAGEAPEDEIV